LAEAPAQKLGRRITLSRPSGTTITGAGTGRGPRLASRDEWHPTPRRRCGATCPAIRRSSPQPSLAHMRGIGASASVTPPALRADAPYQDSTWCRPVRHKHRRGDK
jgi:hypothetical protein